MITKIFKFVTLFFIFFLTIQSIKIEEVLAVTCGGSTYKRTGWTCTWNGATGNNECNEVWENHSCNFGAPNNICRASYLYWPSCTAYPTFCNIGNPYGDHTTAGCNVTCNASDWSSWGNCSVSCGGGTQTRTNPCGGSESRACNTQACETCNSTTFESRNECGPIGACDTTQRRTGIYKSTPAGLWNCSDTCACSESCACGNWTSGACGGGSCAANQRLQTRSCDNGACTGYAESRCVADPTCAFPVTGTVYEDPYRQASLSGTYCDLAGASAVQPGGGSTVSTGYANGAVSAAGTFNVLALGSPPNRTLALNIGDAATWVCTCPAGCSYAVNHTPPGTSGVRYYVSQTRASWFQTIGGDVHADDGSGNFVIHNPVPASCQAPGCKPYTSARDSSGTTGSSGVISYNNGTVDTYGTYGNQTQNTDEDARGYLVNTNREKPIENFAYFMRHFEMPLDPASDFEGTAHDAAYPTNPSVGNKPAYYQQGDLTILNSSWSVAPGDGRVIFVDGNLTIQNTIDVAVGGSLTFIVSGNIIFPASFGSADPTSTTSLVDGIFIADGIIDIQSVGGLTPDLKFIGEGSFIGLSGVQLNRDFHSTSNNTNPAELFRFRPDLVTNIHNSIKKPTFSWKQVAP